MRRDGIIADRVAELANTEDVPLSFGKYRLHRLIARGGMGQVYLAGLVGELGFEKRLVVKTILPELGEDPLFVELFAAEAKTAVALSHGNIMPIYELGRCEGVYYIAMGYVDGPSLAQLLDAHRQQRRPVPVDTALFIVREILTGMAYAHQAEPGRPPVVHRDLSPRNVMLDRSGQVRIVDFGIAMPSRMRVRGGMGSSGYVSPEQARAAPADPRADVFSVACLLYEMISGTQAYPKPDVWAPPDLTTVPAELRPILQAALSVDPGQRPANAGKFLDVLAPIVARHAPTYGDKELAAHMQALFPHGWDRSDAARPPKISEGGQAEAPKTFATRFTLVTRAKPAPLRRVRLAWLAATVVLAGLVLLWSTTEVLRAPPPTRPGRARVAPQPQLPANPPQKSQAVQTLDEPTAHPVRTLEIRVDPPDAILEFGDRTWQGGSPYVVQLSGNVDSSAQVRHPDYVPQTLDLSEATGSLEVRLAHKPREDGRLSVLTPALSWAEVQIDGHHQRNTPLTELSLPAGRHRVVVRCVPDVCDSPRTVYDRRILIRPAQSTEIRIDAEP